MTQPQFAAAIGIGLGTLRHEYAFNAGRRRGGFVDFRSKTFGAGSVGFIALFGILSGTKVRASGALFWLPL